MNFSGDVGSSKAQCKVWRIKFVNQAEIKKMARKNSQKMALETPQKQASSGLHCSGQMPDTHASDHCRRLPCSNTGSSLLLLSPLTSSSPSWHLWISVSLKSLSPGRVFTSNWLHLVHLLVLMPVGREKECLVGTCSLERLMQYSCHWSRKGDRMLGPGRDTC